MEVAQAVHVLFDISHYVIRKISELMLNWVVPAFINFSCEATCVLCIVSLVVAS